MKYGIKKRILSLVLCISMILPMIAQPMPVYSVEAGDAVTNYGAAIGAVAEFDKYFPVPVTDDPQNVESPWGTECEQLSDDETPNDLLMAIIDYYYNSESGDLWYLVQAVPGHEFPEKLQSNPWVYQDNVKSPMGESLIIQKNGTNFIVDADGNVIDPTEGVTVSQYSKVDLTAQSTLQGSVSYQWQIEYEAGKWVDIYGEDSATVKISYGMVATLLDANGSVNIRCRSTSGSRVAYSSIIPVTIEMYQPEEPDVVVTESFTTSSGETVTVTVAGSLPEDASVQLDETDSSGVEARPSETVVAALDISIMNANGTEWQPESGETVTVTLEASKIGLENGEEFVVYHLHNNEVRIIGAFKVVNDTITFEVDGFSKFVFAKVEMLTSTDDLQENVTKKATINDAQYNYLWLVKNPETLKSYTGNWYVQANEGVDYVKGIEFTISGAYVSDVYPYGIFYKVEAVNSDDLLTDVIEYNPWVFQCYQDVPSEHATLIIHEPEQPEVPEIPEAPDFTSHIGKHANLVYGDNVFMVMNEEPDVGYTDACSIFDVEEFSEDFTVKIDGYKVVTEINEVTDEKTTALTGYAVRQSLWYQVSVAEGSGPDDFQDGMWIFQNYITEGEAYENDMLTLFDPSAEPEEPSCGITVDGAAVSEVEVSVEDKVTVTATLANVDAAVVTYQWQILIPTANMWVNISGQTTADCTINYGMVTGRQDADGKVKIRCVATVDGVEITTEPIAVSVLSSVSVASLEPAAEPAAAEPAAEPAAAEPAVEEPIAVFSTRAARNGAAPMAEGDAAGKYYVSVCCYIGDSDVLYGKVQSMEFAVGESARDVSFEVKALAGYTPYYFGTSALTGKENGEKVMADKYTIVNFKPESDMTLTVRYYPNEDTPYKVEHYIQNIYDDEYTFYDDEDKKGTTDELVPSFDGDDSLVMAELEQQGFYAIPYQRVKIASDGSTVIQIYYDRYMYLMLFDLGEGGMGVEPIYGRHGVEYKVGTPKRLGYTFDGWVDDKGNNIGVSSTGEYTFEIPARDMTYTARWKEDDANYTIVFWRADLDDGDVATPTTYSYWGSATVGSVSGTVLTPSTVGVQNPAEDFNVASFDNEEAPYFTYDAEVTAQNNPATVTVAGDGSTIINVYYNRKVFEIRYLYARRAATSSNNNQYQIATLTNDGKVGNWYASSGALPTLKTTAFEAKTERIRTNNTNYDYYYISLRAEYGANIESQWPAAVLNSRGNFNFGSWAAEDGTGYRKNDPEHANIVGSYPYMSAEMIKAGNEDVAYTDEQTGETYYVAQRMSAWWGTDSGLGNPASISEHSYHIYYEVLDGTGDRTYNGKQYKLVRTLDFVAAHNGDTRVDPFYYTGYVCVNDTRGENNSNLNKNTDYQKNSENYKNTLTNKNNGCYNCPDNSCEYCNCFYYDREVNTLSFYNHSEATNAAGKTFASAELKFEQSLSDGLPEGTAAPYEPPYPEGLDVGGYEFKGWYTSPGCYDGTEVDWNSPMPAGDLTVYAKWEPVEHTIEFFFDGSLNERLDDKDFPTQHVLHNNYGEDPGLPGHPMDFEAVTWFYKDAKGEEKSFNFAMPVKEDMKLYPKWRSTVYINYEIRYKIYDQSANEYTDIEIAAPTYGQELYGETITVVPKGTEEFYDAYRTEQNGYFPMTGSHSIIMGESQCSSDPAYTYCTWNEETKTHVFTYYYVNGPKVPYTVKYHLVDADGNVTKLFPDKVVNDNYKAKVVENAAIKIGYKPDAAQKTIFVVHDAINEIIFYYTEDETASWYTVTHYVKKYGSTEHEVYEEYRYVANVGDGVSEYKPITIPGCKYVETKVSNNDYIVQRGDEDTPGFWIALYYEEEPVTIKYEVMGDFGGTVSLQEETIGIAYGTAVGSVAPPLNDAYKFVGWYDLQGNLLSADAKFVPVKVDGLHVAATYYAKFEYNLTSLTIIKNGAEDYKDIDPNQTFIFNIKGDGVDLDVTVHRDENGSWSTKIDGLTVGARYTITEKTDWSWRYSCTGWTHSVGGASGSGEGNTAIITLGLDGTVTFTNTRGNEQWLDGDSWCNNIFSGAKS